jgi:hypothetical protein
VKPAVIAVRAKRLPAAAAEGGAGEPSAGTPPLRSSPRLHARRRV